MPSADLVPFSLTTSRMVSGLAEVSSSEYPGGLRQPRHGHDAAYFTLVLDGAYDERVGRQEAAVGAGRLLFHPMGEEHAVAFRAPLTRVVRLLPRPGMLESAALLGLDLAHPLGRVERALPLMRRLAAESRDRTADAMLAVDALASELLAVIAGAGEGEHAGARAARRARAAIDEVPSARHWLASLAHEAGCHPITLAREFRRSTGCSLGTYVRRARLRLACDLLGQRSLPISMVAATCGFADQAHLTRTMRRFTGRTPAAVMASAAAEGASSVQDASRTG